MSDDATAVTDDATTEDAPAVEEPTAEETPEATSEAADDTTASAEVVETEAEPEAVVEAEEPATEATTEAPSAGTGLPNVRVARVFVCERGHRTTTLWGAPATCQARPVRNGPVCGLPLYHITELPEQVQKALNPLKASKKASKK